MSTDNQEPRQSIFDAAPEWRRDADSAPDDALGDALSIRNRFASASESPATASPVGSGIVPDDFTPPETEPLLLDVENAVGNPTLNVRDLFDQAPDRVRRLFKDSPDAFEDYYYRSDENKQADLRRIITGNMESVSKLLLTMPDQDESIEQIAAKAGMTPDMAAHFQQADPEYLQRETVRHEVLRLSGADGYVTGMMQDPKDAERIRYDEVFFAGMEADILGIYERNFAPRALYDLGVGVGQVGVFGLKGMAGLARLGADVAGWEHSDRTDVAIDAWQHAARTWEGWAKDAEASWLGPAIDTGNPITDWARTAIFQGTPFLAGSVGLAMIPGVGATGAAAVIGGGMGLETYGTLRSEGISPLLAAAAAGGTAISSYYLNTFQLNRWTRNLMGRSPFRRFSVGAAMETAEEFLSESGESLSQGLFEATTRLAAKPGYTRDQWWLDMKESAVGALQEGSAAGFLSLATRMFGLPGAARGQARAHVAARNFRATQEKIGQTQLYQKGQDSVVADTLNMTAKHHGGAGIMFASVQDLQQGGLSKADIVKGLGVSEADYDYARDMNVDLAVPYGNAAVFAKRQADAGNVLFQDIFRADPDAMTGREIVEQQKEMAAILEQAEVNFKAMADEASGAPDRIRIFRAGLRAAGFDANESDAAASLFWARAQRASELWGETPEAWLERRDVQLEMGNVVRTNREWKRYQDMVQLSRLRRDAASGYVSPNADVAEATGQDVFANSPPVDAPAQAAQSDMAAQDSSTASAAQQAVNEDVAQPVDYPQADVAEMVRPVASPEEAEQWVAAAAETIAEASGVDREARAEVAGQVTEMLHAAMDIPEARQVAEQLGLAPVESGQAAAPAATTETQSPQAGRRTKVIFPPESGMPPLPARYALVELSSLQPSHLFRNYTPNPAWTGAELAQQRNYDSGAMEAVRQGIELEPLNLDAVFNPGTDAVNGPPIVTADGKVLGGNNRSHRIFNRYQADSYRDGLVWHLSTEENMTGIRPETAMAMERPVLVRVVDDVDASDIPGLIGALNADFTNRRDPANLAANRGMRVGERTLSAFAGINDRSVAAYLDSPATARRVLQAMVEDGALQSTDLPGLYDFANDKWLGDGRSSGKAQVEQALFGAILPDSRLLDDLSDGMKRKLVRALPGLIRMKRNNALELANLFGAVELFNDFQNFKESPQAKGLKPAARLELFRRPNQADLFTGEAPPEKSGPAWDMFLELNSMRSQREVADYFTRKADEIAGVGRGLFDGMQLYQDAISAGERLDEAMRQRGRVREMLRQAIDNPSDNRGFFDLRPVTAVEADIVRNEAGVSIDGYRHMVDVSGLQHIWSRHGGENEKNPANIPLTEEDIANIPVYLLTPTRVHIDGKNDQRQDVIKYEYDLDDSTMVVLEAVRTGRKKLAVYAMRRERIKGAGNPQLYGRTASSPEDGRSGIAGNPNITIPNADGDVKSGGEIIEELYQPAYHGSPHRFDKFTTDAMGTGEGAQAYGWGLYFAGNREVAEWYRKNLTRTEYAKTFDGVKISHVADGTFALEDGREITFENNKLEYIALNLLEGSTKQEAVSYVDDLFTLDDAAKDEVRNIINNRVADNSGELGQLYKVDVPESDLLLDWDKPLSKKQKKQIAEQAVKEGYDDESIAYWNEDGALVLNYSDSGNGRFFYKSELSRILGSPKAASEFLNRAGIKGIRYLDGASRGKGEGDYNYVIFDDNAIDILETYYQGDLNSPRGAIRFQSAADAPTVIKIFQNADISTVVHELNHLFIFDLQQMVAAGRGGEQARADLAALTAFAGGKLDRAGYEKIAQAWERYAMDGRAPSPDLVDAFDTFREYIGRVYANATREFGVEPSAEVRAVFDRFLATDQQIAEAREIEEQSGYWFDQVKGIAASAKERMRAVIAKVDKAKRKKSDAEHGGKALGRLGDNNIQTLRAAMGKTDSPSTYDAISRAKRDGGFDRGAVESLIGKEGAAEIAKRHGEDIYGHGADLSDISDIAGYRDMEEMLTDISMAPPVVDAAKAKTEREVAAEEEAGRRRDESEGEALGDEEVDVEEEALVAQVEESIKAAGGGARGLRDFRIMYAAQKKAARHLVGAKALREAVDIRPFQKAKKEANRKALAASKRGDMAKVSEFLNLELMHHLTIRESMRARDLRERIIRRYGTRALKIALNEGGQEHRARIENEYAEAIKAIATFVGLTRNRNLRPQTDGEIIPFPTYEPGSNVAGFLPDIAGSVEPWLLNKVYPQGYQDWRDFTVDQLREVDRVMQILMKQGAGELSAMRDLDARNLEELVEKSTAPMGRRDSVSGQRDDRSPWGRALNRINDFLISITIPENWFMAMDGNPTISGREAGINQRMFWKMRDCQTVKDKLYKDLIERMQPDFDQLAKAKRDIEARFGAARFVVPNLEMQAILKKGRDYATWDADTLLSVCLNMGNDASLYRLTGILKNRADVDFRENGYNFTEQDLAHIAALFDADTWRSIQNIWDGVGSLYDQLDAVTYRITNRHVVKESAMPLTVTTSDGEVLALKGGYFPLVNDPFLSSRAAQLKEGSGIEDAINSGVMDNIHQSTKPAAGMIKERLRDEDGNPVVRLPQILKTDILIRHLDAATHYISHAETILEFDRLTRDAEWRGMYIDKFGQEQYRAVRNWVQNLARPNRMDNSAGAMFMEKMRTLATINGLGLRFTTGLKQRLGYAQAINFMTDNSRTKSSGWKWMKAGVREMGFMGNVIGRNREKIDWVNGESDYMRTRQGGHDRELRAQLEKLNPLSSEIKIPFTNSTFSKRKLHDGMFAWIQANDTAAAYAAWIGGFKQAMAGEANFDIAGMTQEQIHKEAVKYADSVAATQASSFSADLTEMQRNTGLMRFLAMFMSGNVRQGSRLMQYLDAHRLGDKGKADVAWLAFREFIAPSLAWIFMAAAVKSMLGDDDDDLLTEAAWESVETALAPFPLVRDVSSSLRYGSARVPAVDGPFKAIGQIAGAPGNVADGKYLRAIGDAFSGFGFFVGVPVMNPIRDARPLTDAAGITEPRRR